MKIYTVNGRKVWLNKAPEGYEEAKAEIKEVEPKVETKAKKTTANKARKAGSNK